MNLKSRDFDRQSEIAINEANRYYTIELAIAFFIAFLCNLFVTSVSAKSFHDTYQANNVTLQNAVNIYRTNLNKSLYF